MDKRVHLVAEEFGISTEAVEALVSLVREGTSSSGEYVDVTEIARRFGVSRDWVYAHANEIGVIRVGSRLRFDPEVVAKALAPPEVPPPRIKRGQVARALKGGEAVKAVRSLRVRGD